MVAGHPGGISRFALAAAAALLLYTCGGGGGGTGGLPGGNPPSNPPAPAPPPVVPPVVTPPPPPSLPETVLSFSGTIQANPNPVVPAVKSPLFVTAIAFDATRNQLVAGAILSNNTTAVVGLNPTDFSVIWTAATTSPATVLAVSDDGSMLYAGLFFESAVQQIDLTAHTSVRTFAVANPSSGMGAFDIAVRPGSPDTVAISVGDVILIPTFRSLALYVQGVKQPKGVSETDFSRASQIEFLDAATLVTLDNETTGFHLQKFSVAADGLTFSSFSPDNCCGSHLGVVNGRIFLSSGTFVDPVTLKSIKSVGRDSQDFKLFHPGTNSVIRLFAENTGVQTSARFLIEEYDPDGGFLKRRFRADETVPGTDPQSGVFTEVIDAVPTGPSSFAVLVADDLTGLTALLSYDLSAIPLLSTRTFVAQSSTVGNVSALSIPLAFNSYAYDPAGDRIVVTTPPTLGPQGNSLAIIRPSDGTVERFVPLSSEPRDVTVSPSGSIAYVVLPFEPAIQQVDIGTGALGSKMVIEFPTLAAPNQYPFPTVRFSPSSIAVKPDDPQTIAIAGCAGVGGYECGQTVAVFQNGTQTGFLGPRTTFPGGNVPLTFTVAFNGPGELLGFDSQTSNGSIQHYSYGNPGLLPVSAKLFLIDSGTTGIGFGYAYSRFSVFDIQTDTKIGTFLPGSTDFFFFDQTLLTSSVSGVGFNQNFSPGPGHPTLFFERLTSTVKSDGSLQFAGQNRISIDDPRFPSGFSGPLIQVGTNRFAHGLTNFADGTGVIYVISIP